MSQDLRACVIEGHQVPAGKGTSQSHQLCGGRPGTSARGSTSEFFPLQCAVTSQQKSSPRFCEPQKCVVDGLEGTPAPPGAFTAERGASESWQDWGGGEGGRVKGWGLGRGSVSRVVSAASTPAARGHVYAGGPDGVPVG